MSGGSLLPRNRTLTALFLTGQGYRGRKDAGHGVLPLLFENI